MCCAAAAMLLQRTWLLQRTNVEAVGFKQKSAGTGAISKTHQLQTYAYDEGHE